MIRCIRITLFLFLFSIFSFTNVLAEDTDASAPSPNQVKEISRKRLTHSKKNPLRLLSLPKYILEIPWYPAKKFLDFSERTDLFTRIMDLFYFNEERTIGWFPAFSSGGSGEGGGASLFHHNLFDKKHKANISFTYADEEEYFIRSAYTVEPNPSNPYFFKFKSEYIEDQDVEIYTRGDINGQPILGSDTNEEDEKDYSIKKFDSQITIGRKLHPTFDLKLFVRGEATEALDPRPQLVTLPPSLKGLGEKVGLAGGGTNLSWDFRDNPARPYYGFLIDAQAGVNASPKRSTFGNHFGYAEYAVDWQHFFPIYEPNRVLVIRQSLRRVEPLGTRQIPFYSLPVLDLNHLLRSFDRNRFRDRGAITFNAEYRYPVWVTWDAYLFFDAGQSFGEYTNVQARQFRYSYGAGIRFLSKDKLLFILEYGYGKEEQALKFSFGQTF